MAVSLLFHSNPCKSNNNICRLTLNMFSVLCNVIHRLFTGLDQTSSTVLVLSSKIKLSVRIFAWYSFLIICIIHVAQSGIKLPLAKPVRKVCQWWLDWWLLGPRCHVKDIRWVVLLTGWLLSLSLQVSEVTNAPNVVGRLRSMDIGRNSMFGLDFCR